MRWGRRPRILGENAIFCPDYLPIEFFNPPAVEVLLMNFFVPRFSVFSRFLYSTFLIIGATAPLRGNGILPLIIYVRQDATSTSLPKMRQDAASTNNPG